MHTHSSTFTHSFIAITTASVGAILNLTLRVILSFSLANVKQAYTHIYAPAEKKPCKIDAASMLCRTSAHTYTHAHAHTVSSHFFFDDNTHRQRKRTEKEERKKAPSSQSLVKTTQNLHFHGIEKKKTSCVCALKIATKSVQFSFFFFSLSENKSDGIVLMHQIKRRRSILWISVVGEKKEANCEEKRIQFNRDIHVHVADECVRFESNPNRTNIQMSITQSMEPVYSIF